MDDLTPLQHAQLGCDYLDELLIALQAQRWRFSDSALIEMKISQHAEALGLPAPLERFCKPAKGREEQVWLSVYDPVTEERHERPLFHMIYAPPPIDTVKEVYVRLSKTEQAEFRIFVDRLKRELLRRGRTHAEAARVEAGDGVLKRANVDQKWVDGWLVRLGIQNLSITDQLAAVLSELVIDVEGHQPAIPFVGNHALMELANRLNDLAQFVHL